jgi:cytochrome c oxidase subunit 2
VPGAHRSKRRLLTLSALTLVTASCGRNQSTLKPHSDAAHSIATLWWVLFVGSAIVVAVVTLLVVVAVLRRRGSTGGVDRDARGSGLVLVSGAVVPMVVLVALFVYVLSTLDATAQPRGSGGLTVEVVGKQWFWAVRYPAQRITTANELHIPVGVPVKVVARTDDVIHSFWVPELNRKIDMIPGRTNTILLRADRPGLYRGQCAEFCGLQHAHMAFFVVAETRAQWARWVAQESQPPPGRGSAGERVFLDSGCSGCHTIAGASDATIGPDLTHVASRLTLAAGTVPNTKGWLASWIIDPQHVKPGNKMPGLPLSGQDLQALLDYLERLR